MVAALLQRTARRKGATSPEVMVVELEWHCSPYQAIARPHTSHGCSLASMPPRAYQYGTWRMCMAQLRKGGLWCASVLLLFVWAG